MAYVQQDAHYAATYIVDEILDSELGYAKGPVRSLMSAVLFDGIQAYMSYAFEVKNGRDGRKFQEAHAWVHHDHGAYIFSFDSVCEGLGIEPDWLRLGLANAVRSDDLDFRKSRRAS